MNYALYEALRIVVEEGLVQRFARHQANATAIRAGLDAISLKPVAQEGHQLPQLAVVAIPHGIDDAKVRAELLRHFNIEIAGGLGPFKGKVWRIGLLGESSTRENVMMVLNALEAILSAQGLKLARGTALRAADQAYAAIS
jgi:alanine-glyoxylate transaminase/serine-glyoxylate transaminase/serine-pyruvate transaminase